MKKCHSRQNRTKSLQSETSGTHFFRELLSDRSDQSDRSDNAGNGVMTQHPQHTQSMPAANETYVSRPGMRPDRLNC